MRSDTREKSLRTPPTLLPGAICNILSVMPRLYSVWLLDAHPMASIGQRTGRRPGIIVLLGEVLLSYQILVRCPTAHVNNRAEANAPPLNEDNPRGRWGEERGHARTWDGCLREKMLVVFRSRRSALDKSAPLSPRAYQPGCFNASASVKI